MKNIRRILFVLLAFVLLAGPAWAGDVKNLIWVIGDGMGPEAIGFFTQGVRYANLPDYPRKNLQFGAYVKRRYLGYVL